VVQERRRNAPDLPDEVAVLDAGVEGFEVAVHELSGMLVVEMAGELDLATGAELTAATAGLSFGGRAVCLAVGNLRFCDATGLEAIVDLWRRAVDAGGRCWLHRPGPRLERLVRVCLTPELFDPRDRDLMGRL
jgi:anti-anti-sigma factor